MTFAVAATFVVPQSGIVRAATGDVVANQADRARFESM